MLAELTVSLKLSLSSNCIQRSLLDIEVIMYFSLRSGAHLICWYRPCTQIFAATPSKILRNVETSARLYASGKSIFLKKFNGLYSSCISATVAVTEIKQVISRVCAILVTVLFFIVTKLMRRVPCHHSRKPSGRFLGFIREDVSAVGGSSIYPA